jgi:hydrogenase maturation protease
MSEPRPSVKALVVGIGSLIRGDDGIGVHAVRRLKDEGIPDHVHTLEVGTGGLSLLDYVEGYDRLVIIDAIVTGAPAGTVHELHGEETARTVHLAVGHEADLPTTLALGKKLSKTMPETVVVVAVEAGDLTSFSESLTPEVEAALPKVLSKVRNFYLTSTGSMG